VIVGVQDGVGHELGDHELCVAQPRLAYEVQGAVERRERLASRCGGLRAGRQFEREHRRVICHEPLRRAVAIWQTGYSTALRRTPPRWRDSGGMVGMTPAQLREERVRLGHQCRSAGLPESLQYAAIVG